MNNLSRPLRRLATHAAVALTLIVAAREGSRSRGDDTALLCGAPEFASRVTLHGRLAPRYSGNVQYLLDQHERRGTFMADAYRLREHRKTEADWDGEYAAKWLDAAAHTAADADHAILRTKALELAAAVRRSQQPDRWD